jgi:hypothetical protein
MVQELAPNKQRADEAENCCAPKLRGPRLEVMMLDAVHRPAASAPNDQIYLKSSQQILTQV